VTDPYDKVLTRAIKSLSEVYGEGLNKVSIDTSVLRLHPQNCLILNVKAGQDSLQTLIYTLPGKYWRG
jgi:hypothetical protein